MTDTNIRHEVEVDTRIAVAYEVYAEAELAVQRIQRQIKTALNQRFADEYATRLPAAREAAAVAEASYVAASAEYTGWSRFFLVKNSNGHIHSSLGCSTCTRTTQYAWLTDVSGLTEAEAVAIHGERLCTVCYPSAPSAWTDADAYYARIARETRDERAAEKAAKEAEKAAKVAKRRETVHYGIRFHRESDGAVIDHFMNYRGTEIDWTAAKSLKAAQKHVKESGTYNGRYAIVDLLTGQEVE